MKMNFPAVSLCVGLGMACSAYGAFIANFNTAPGALSDLASAPAIGGWTLIPTDISITDLENPLSDVYAFVLGASGGNPYMYARITGSVTISGTGEWNGPAQVTATIQTITFKLTKYSGAEVDSEETWVFSGLQDSVELEDSEDWQVATFDSGWLSHTFGDSMAMPGTYSLAWQMTGVGLSGEGAIKGAEFGTVVLDARGAAAPEAQEFALIVGLGLVAFAGWRRVRA